MITRKMPSRTKPPLPLFVAVVRDRDGGCCLAQARAESPEQACQRLEERGLDVLSVSQAAEATIGFANDVAMVLRADLPKAVKIAANALFTGRIGAKPFMMPGVQGELLKFTRRKEWQFDHERLEWWLHNPIDLQRRRILRQYLRHIKAKYHIGE